MQQPKPLLVAGATGYGAWPANSLEGAVECLKAPVDGIEIDVQLTADGHVVAHHDYRLSPNQTRLKGDWIETPSAPFKDLTLDELRRYDLGRARPSDRPNRYPEQQQMDGVAIPTLPELLKALKAAPGAPRLIYIEVKTDPQDPSHAPEPEAIVEAVFRDLDAADYVTHAKIIAFDWKVLRLSEVRSPGVATAHLTIPAILRASVKLNEDGRLPWGDGYDSIDYDGSVMRAIQAHGGMEWSPYYTEVTAETMAEARELGLKVGPWGLSKGDDIRRMADLGVFSSTVSGPDWGR